MPNNFLDLLQLGRPLTPDEIAQKELIFRDLETEEREAVWVELHKYFKTTSPQEDKKYWLSYFRWYTWISWKYLLTRDQDFVAEIAIPRQLVMASLLEFDVQQELFWYFDNTPFTQEELNRYYARMQNNFLHSAGFVGMNKGVAYSIAELVNDAKRIEAQNNSLQTAEELSRVGSIIFYEPKLMDQYIVADHDTVITDVLNMVTLFLGVSAENIFYMMDGIVHPEKYQALLEKKFTKPSSVPVGSKVNTSVVSSPTATLQPPKIQPTSTPQPRVENKPTIKTTSNSKTSALGRPSNNDIKKMVEALFPTPPSGEIAHVEEVVAMLTTLAEKYQDSSIEELCYYNEQQGSFHWNDSMF